MAVVAVTANNTRVAVATIATDTGTWGNDGGGGGVSDEPDIVYQGSTAQSRKVSTSPIGRSYTHGSGTDMDGTPASTAHYIAKINITNYNALLARTSGAGGPGTELKIGSSSSAYHSYYLWGNDNYPSLGGWQIIAIAPSVSGYAAEVGDTGSPNDSSILYWSILGDFSASSKSENVVIDAIDVGLGLGLVGGDGADTDGVFSDFVSYDQGTTGNRFGYCTSFGQVVSFIGQVAIGQTGSGGTSTATVFQDSGVTCVWQNGLVTTGFHRLLIDLATSGTDIDFTNCTLLSEGQENNDGDRGYTTTEDSRPILEVTGSTGAFDMNQCVVDNFASFTLNSACTLDRCVITNSGAIDCGTGATLAGTSISGTTEPVDGYAVLWNVASDPAGELDDMSFTKGTLAHHAIEFGTSIPSAITLNGHSYSGFNASNAANDSVLNFLDTTGTIDVTIANGGDTPSYKTAGATINIIAGAVTVEVTATTDTGTPIQNARVLLKASDGTGPFPFEESVTIANAGTTATVTHTAHGMATNDYVEIEGGSLSVNDGVFQITVTGVNTYTYTLASSPGASPTGSITSTFVALYGLTDVNGEISTTRTYSTDQPVTGVSRKSSASPFYKTGPINGTVGSTTGFSGSAVMILDE